MKIIDVPQGSPEWLFERIGLITSTKIADCIKKRKRIKEGEQVKELQARVDLKYELVCELLTNRPSEHYVSKWMKEGKEKEPLARTEYEMQRDVYVDLVGLVLHSDHPGSRFGCSPDGLVGNDGVVEFKCPQVTTHVQYIEAGTIPEEYLPQCMWHLACTEREWCDFASFHELMPKHRKLFVKRMWRNDAVISAMQLEARRLQQEVDDILGRIRERNREDLGEESHPDLLITDRDVKQGVMGIGQ